MRGLRRLVLIPPRDSSGFEAMGTNAQTPAHRTSGERVCLADIPSPIRRDAYSPKTSARQVALVEEARAARLSAHGEAQIRASGS